MDEIDAKEMIVALKREPDHTSATLALSADCFVDVAEAVHIAGTKIKLAPSWKDFRQRRMRAVAKRRGALRATALSRRSR